MESYEEQIKELKERLVKLEAKLKESKEKSKRWKPENHKIDYYLDTCRNTACINWIDDETGECLRRTRICFETEEEAEQKLAEIGGKDD